MNSLAERGGAPPAGARAGTSTQHRLARRVAVARPDSSSRGSSSTGFSLVELLVTIVLAGIIFAALVPVFVSAQKASSGDKARNVAMNVAQDRIEKIRLLGFDQVIDDASHLQSASFAGGQFGTTFTPAGASRPYSVTYSVENVPSTGAVNYKRVGVTVSWTAPPAPVQPVTLTTIVMNPQATSASSSPTASPSTSPSPSPSPTPTPTPTVGTFALTVIVSGGNWVNPTTGITVVQTNVTPNLTRTPSPQFPTTTSNAVWGGLPAGTYLVTCNYYKNGKTNGNGPKTLAQTVYITTSDLTYTFDLTQ
jgi:prepilin-type N-terminal cleavage/methylation domain-containing protein